MTYIKTNALALVALIIAILALFTPAPKSAQSLGSATVTPTNYDNLTLSHQLVVGGAALRTDGLTSSATNTLALADIQGNSTIVETSATATAYTIKFPATSTLSGWLPHQGDWTDIVFYNASTTGPTISFASSTGVTLKASGTTTALYQSAGGSMVNMRVFRIATGGDFLIQMGATI